MMASVPQRVFSGIQPTGIPHIGNYLGAIKNWIKIQNEAKPDDVTIFSIVDLHSTTTHFDPVHRKRDIFEMVASLLACGINPEKSLLFQQSRVPCHTELSWVLGCMTMTQRLNSMHHWKTKKEVEEEVELVGKHSSNNLGLYSYPVLMAADILLYKSTHVPVGDDQVQHMNLTRHLVQLFNNRYTNTFPVPQTLVTNASRVMNLKNPLVKMSKSDTDAKSRIELTDSCDQISKKIRKAVTDSKPYIRDGSLSERPGVSNLLSIYSGFTGLHVDDIVEKYAGVEYFTAPLKRDLCDVVINEMKPIREEFNSLTKNCDYLEDVLVKGSETARNIAEETVKEVYQKLGLR